MSTLAVTVKVAGNAAPGLGVQIFPQSIFTVTPLRGFGFPNSAPTSTGTTNASGQTTLTGMSAVAYQLVVTDARGVNNWFQVPAAYVGGAYTAIIPWTTPTSVTKPVSTGGDTPGGANLTSPFSQRPHFHEVTATPGSYTGFTPPISARKAVAVSGTKWIVGGTGGIATTTDQGVTWTTFTTSSFQCFALAVSGSTVLAIGTATGTPAAYVASTDGGVTWGSIGAIGTMSSVGAIGSTSGGPAAAIDEDGTWWAVGVNPGATPYAIYKSTNSGASWTTVTAVGSFMPIDLAIVGDTMLLSGENTSISQGQLVISLDAGATWPDYSSFGSNFYGCAVISPTLQAWCGGSGNPIIEYGNVQAGGAGGTSIPGGHIPPAFLGTGYRIKALDANNWVAVGTPGTAGATIGWTHNGGSVWGVPGVNPFSTSSNDAAMLSSSQVLIVGDGSATPQLVLMNI